MPKLLILISNTWQFLSNRDSKLTRYQKIENEKNCPINNPVYDHFNTPDPNCWMNKTIDESQNQNVGQ